MFVLNCVDGCIPSDLATGSSEEIEEERRLLYVAMTRARDALTLIVPQRFYVHGQAKNGDRYVSAARTRFIPSAAAEALRARRLAAPRRRSSAPPSPQARKVDLARACGRCGSDTSLPSPRGRSENARLATGYAG